MGAQHLLALLTIGGMWLWSCGGAEGTWVKIKKTWPRVVSAVFIGSAGVPPADGGKGVLDLGSPAGHQSRQVLVPRRFMSSP